MRIEFAYRREQADVFPSSADLRGKISILCLGDSESLLHIHDSHAFVFIRPFSGVEAVQQNREPHEAASRDQTWANWKFNLHIEMHR
jgi:hypothetical protein